MARSQKSQSERTFELSHRAADIVGIALIAFALLLLLTLSFRNGGLLGNAFAGIFSLLFGRGAWVVPLACGIAGTSLLLGHAKFQATRVTWGTILIFLGLLAAIARPENGDYFVESAMTASGGYIGAIAGWVLGGLFGAFKLLAVSAVVLVGAVLCFDQPIRELFKRLAKPGSRKVLVTRGEPVDRTEDRKRAAVRILGNESESEEQSEEAPVKKKPAVLTGGSRPREITLDTTANEPKDGYILPPLSLLTEPLSHNKRD